MSTNPTDREVGPTDLPDDLLAEPDELTDQPGSLADDPRKIPRQGWVQIGKRAMKQVKADMVPLMAAGVAFWGFLALFPTMIAATLVYGLVSDPADIADQLESLQGALPPEAIGLVEEQMRSLAQADSQGLGIGLAIAVLTALWSASGGMGHLVEAVNRAYDEDETRSFVKKRGLGLGLTFGAIVMFSVVIALIAAFPVVFGDVTGIAGVLLQVARWALLLVVFVVALAVLYRLAPNREDARLRWVSVGSVFATAIWLLASIGFSLYTTHFGSYAETYGALAGVVILLLWMFLTAFAVLFGAEVNAEMEHQTMRDTTTGAARPMGERDAKKADTLPDDPEGSTDRG